MQILSYSPEREHDSLRAPRPTPSQPPRPMRSNWARTGALPARRGTMYRNWSWQPRGRRPLASPSSAFRRTSFVSSMRKASADLHDWRRLGRKRLRIFGVTSKVVAQIDAAAREAVP